MTQRYQGRTVAFLTQHGKEALIGPLLQSSLGCTVVRAEGFDTDQLGTFCGDIHRHDTQLQTARSKARIGLQLTGETLGLASEGAFTPDPFGGLMPWNIEMLVWLDDAHALEVVGMAQGPARNLQRAVRNVAELEQFAREAGFPDHHLVLRPQSDRDLRLHKGLSTEWALKEAFQACQSAANNQLVFAEHDLRAFCNPTRQSMIRAAAENLLSKIQTPCPACDAPGFSITAHTAGLPCSSCGHPTRLAKSSTWSCASCLYRSELPSDTPHATPNKCDVCNP